MAFASLLLSSRTLRATCACLPLLWLCFAVEALLKIGAWGFLLAPNTYLRSGECGLQPCAPMLATHSLEIRATCLATGAAFDTLRFWTL